jgi:CMP-N,N'-diacetyllegionaminic acid synthase
VRVLGVIPARGGSKRVPGKNLAVLEGRTLVRRALEAAIGSGALAEVALSSEDERILAQAEGLAVRPLRRPPELATDAARSFDVVRHALATIEAGGSQRFDAVAVIQATAPFTAPEDVAGTVALLASRPGFGSAVSVVEVDMVHHPLKLKRLEGERLVPFLEEDDMVPSHELPRLYVRNGAVYVTRRELLDQGTFISSNCLGYRMPAERSVDIDTPLDLAFAEFLVGRGARKPAS